MTTENIIDVPQWYAVYTKPKQEERADSNLRAWNVKTFAPKIREKRLNPFTGRPTFITKPLFSRYIFAHFTASTLLHQVCFTRGVQGVVCSGGSPSPVDDDIIEFIKSREDEHGYVKLSEELLPGDKVIISQGHLKDFAGIFEGEISEQDRVAILLTTINYQARVVVERDQVRRVC